MDIEIHIRIGKRHRLDSGSIKWDDYTDDSCLISYSVDEVGAVREALFQVEKSLRDSLGLDSLQSD